MRTIHKYTIPYLNQTEKTFVLPKGAFVRDIAAQELPNRVISIWMEVDIDSDNQELEKRTFELFATGAEIPKTAYYVGTTIGRDNLVMHVYETVDARTGYLAEKTIPIVTDL